jgi:hypothetical protein
MWAHVQARGWGNGSNNVYNHSTTCMYIMLSKIQCYINIVLLKTGYINVYNQHIILIQLFLLDAGVGRARVVAKHLAGSSLSVQLQKHWFCGPGESEP